ncbi:hypothetical protein BN7_1861 [Wickerhamomyces ciferrii]|uniref:Uncharacterized protein n=1 Tax=Wickerhamomyces ciferrii (strain ATCC 14091 / BCRC 22168 / CBS 111 / JCM 3599 / NBRC 0793 / NRRL Y-1031 F-60-10) TaxID=1206466 RepID=K0KJL5_WICCF|nr:uncharacterized protein BN7_1861 [Wickerhamomyces ciferrii]CCH42317.1 hypothetical protein BN7_1861 [Wickerhamomyces ciferrii]
MSEARLKIGIDVGGTNTDCVLLDPTRQSSPDRGIISYAKTSTTPDITSGIFQVIQLVLNKANINTDQVALVTIGTTHFLNAILERDSSRLDKVGIIRLSSNFTKSIPPFSDFPQDLKQVIYGYHGFVSGGLQIDGSLISKINKSEIIQQCHEIKKRGLTSIVIIGVYSPLDNKHNQEYKVREIIQSELPNINIVCSRDVGTLGFLERENASILNASILRFSEYVIKSFKSALTKLSLNCPLYLTQNDGTIIPADQVKRIPIVTFSSGPTNSILGAAYLSQIKSETSTLVADVGGTSCDIGILLPSGFPKQASAYLSIAGVRVNYAMPHVHTIGLGGGSIVTENNDDQITTSVGPESVGHSLTTHSLVFGGKTLTATDIAMLYKKIEKIEGGGEISKMSQKIPTDLTNRAFQQIQLNLSKAIDSIRTSPVDLPLILVGGGSIIIGDQIKGVSEIIRPLYHEYANAVGAAVAKMAIVIDTVISTDSGLTFQQIIESKKNEAIESLIVKRGAIRESVYVADITSLPIPYAINKIRVIIKVAGEIDLDLIQKQSIGEVEEDDEDDIESSFKFQRTEIKKSINQPPSPKEKFDVLGYKPNIHNGEWKISLIDLKWISNGCYVLGCAGGGSPQCEYLEVKNILEEGYEIKLYDHKTIQDSDIIAWGGIMGSPAVSYERLGGTDTVDALSEIIKFTGYHIDDIKALMCLEIGGANGLQPFIMASSKHFNKPLLDCDWMGRAYPTYYQTTLASHTEGKISPAAISDGVGNSLVLTSSNSDYLSDVILRAACGEMGSRVGYAGRPTEGFLVREFAVKNSYSLAWRIGKQIAYCQENNCIDQVADQIIEQIGGSSSGKKLFQGKITSVEQKLYKGHEYGQIIVSSFGLEEQDQDCTKYSIPFVKNEGVVKIPYKNEIMYAEHEFQGTKAILASVPDLISVIDSQSGQAIGVPEFKYGLRVTIIGIAGSNLWKDCEKSRELGGLEAFGLADSAEHKPLGVYTAPQSVFDEVLVMSSFEIFLPDTVLNEGQEFTTFITRLREAGSREIAFFDEVLTGYILLNKESNQQPINTTLDLNIRGENEQSVNLKSLELVSPIKSEPTRILYKFMLFLSYPKIKLDHPKLNLKVQTNLNNRRKSIELQSNQTLVDFQPAEHRNILAGIQPTIPNGQNKFLMNDAILSDSLIKHNKLEESNENHSPQNNNSIDESDNIQISKEFDIPTIRILNLRVRNIRIKKNSILSTIDVELSSKFKDLSSSISLNNINYRFQNTVKPKFNHQFPIEITKFDNFSFTFQLDSNDYLSYKTLIEINYSLDNHQIKTKWITNIDFGNTPHIPSVIKRSSTSSLPNTPSMTSLSSGLNIKFIGNKQVKIGQVFKLRAHIINNSKRNRNLVMVFNSQPEAFLPNLPKIKSLIQTNLNILKFYSQSKIKTTGILSLVNEVHFKVNSDQVFESEILLVGLEFGVFNLNGVKLIDLATGESMSCDKLLEVVVIE